MRKFTGVIKIAMSRRTRSLPQVPSPTLSLHLQSKLSLVWAKATTPLYRPLSTNVLREICQFLSFNCLLAKCSGRDLLVFDPSQLQLRRVEIRNTELSFHRVLPPECVCIGDRQIFICGGAIAKARNYSTTARTTVMEVDQAVQLRDMRTARCLHGLYYDQISRRVFAFGGRLKPGKVSDKCEQFDLRSGFWSQLPSMIEEKSHISTCGYHGKVYICGNTRQCEVFEIAESRFALIPIQRLLGFFFCAVEVWQSKLILIQKNTVRVWDVNTYEFIEDKEIGEDLSLAKALVSGSELYFFEDAICRSMNLEKMNFGMTYS